jgi:hypothetical protein
MLLRNEAKAVVSALLFLFKSEDDTHENLIVIISGFR